MRWKPLCECLCSEFSLAQQNRTKEGLGPVLAGQRGSAHRTDMKMPGFIRQYRRTRWTTTGTRCSRVAATLETADRPVTDLVQSVDVERCRKVGS